VFCLLGHINQTDVVGTPEGFKWLYDFFIKMQAITKAYKGKDL
jgi:ssDNA-specific exonuclease RecJ